MTSICFIIWIYTITRSEDNLLFTWTLLTYSKFLADKVKKHCVMQKFKDDYLAIYPYVIVKSKEDKFHTHCNICITEFVKGPEWYVFHENNKLILLTKGTSQNHQSMKLRRDIVTLPSALPSVTSLWTLLNPHPSMDFDQTWYILSP